MKKLLFLLFVLLPLPSMAEEFCFEKPDICLPVWKQRFIQEVVEKRLDLPAGTFDGWTEGKIPAGVSLEDQRTFVETLYLYAFMQEKYKDDETD